MVSRSVLKRLFARSDNTCAFPGCSHLLVDDDGHVIGHVAHIAARRPSGPRYDSSMTADERDSFENLILLCPTHHVTVDHNPDTFTLDSLVEMKRSAEALSGIALSDDQVLGVIDIEIEVADVVPARNFDNDWLIIKLDGFYLLNNMDRNAILQFELECTLDGERLVFTRDPYDEFRKGGHLALTGHLPNPKDAPAASNFADPLAFLVERRGRATNRPVREPLLLLTERRSRRSFNLPIPGKHLLS